MIPVVVRTTENMLRLVPNSLRSRRRPGRAAMEGDHVGHPARLQGWRDHRHPAGGGADFRRNRPLLFTALNNQFWNSNMNAPMANLPIVIFQFAMSPYEDWHTLAWAGSLLITFSVLTNILARWFGSQQTSSQRREHRRDSSSSRSRI